MPSPTVAIVILWLVCMWLTALFQPFVDQWFLGEPLRIGRADFVSYLICGLCWPLTWLWTLIGVAYEIRCRLRERDDMLEEKLISIQSKKEMTHAR